MLGCKINEKQLYSLYINSLFGDNTDKRNRLKYVLKKAMKRQLTPRQQQTLQLYYVENLKQKDIAVLLNIDKSAVCRHIQKAKKTLNTFLEYNIYLKENFS